MSRVSEGQRARAAVAMGIAARKTDEAVKARVSLNPFRTYTRSLARSWDYGYKWAWLERKFEISPKIWMPGLGVPVRRRKPVEKKIDEKGDA